MRHMKKQRLTGQVESYVVQIGRLGVSFVERFSTEEEKLHQLQCAQINGAVLAFSLSIAS